MLIVTILHCTKQGAISDDDLLCLLQNQQLPEYIHFDSAIRHKMCYTIVEQLLRMAELREHQRL